MFRAPTVRITALVACLSLLATACGDSSDPDEPGAAGTTTTTSEPGTSPEPTTASDQPNLLDPPDPDDPGSPQDTTPEGQVLLPNEYGAPEPGRYQYQVGGDDPALLEVYDLQSEAPDRTKDLRQVHIWTTEERADSHLISWQADGAHLEAQQTRQPDGSESPICAWDPRQMELPRPATVGTEWSFDSTCRIDEDITRRRVGVARIVGTERLEVAGGVHEVVVIEREYDVITRSDDQTLDVGQRYDLTDKWAPGLRLLAVSDGTVAETIQGVAREPRPHRWTLVDATPHRGTSA